jgi:hypothetical protein
VRANIVPIRIAALPVLILGAIVVFFEWWPDPTKVPEPKLLFIPGKTFETPVRVIHFLALIAVLSVAFPYIAKGIPRITSLLSMLGRNALPVFLRRLAAEPRRPDPALLFPRRTYC